MRLYILLVITFLLSGCSVIRNVQNYVDNQKALRKQQEEERLLKECLTSYHTYKKDFFAQKEYLFDGQYETIKSDNYDDFWEDINNQTLQLSNGKKIKLKEKISLKNNTLFSYLLLDDMNNYIEVEKAFLKILQNGSSSVEKSPVPIPENFFRCSKYHDLPEYESLQKHYKILVSLSDKIYQISYEQERKDFFHKTGFYIAQNGWDEGNTLIPYMVGLPGQPAKQFLYRLEGLRVLQSVPGGILVEAMPSVRLLETGYDSNIIFVATPKRFPDGYPLNNISVVMTGTKTYQNILGASRTVYAFKVVDSSKYKKYLDQYYFYPSLRSTSTVDEEKVKKIINKMFVNVE